MTDDIILYTNPMSRGRMGRWMLEEVGQPYRVEILDLANMSAPEYLAVNPMGKVPAIRHGDVVVTECAAICAYLADAFPAAGLAPPPGDPRRGAYYRWLFFAAGPIESAALIKALDVTVPPERERMAGFGSLGRVTATLDAVLSETSYLTGDQFTAADLYLGAQVGWGMQFGTFERRPSFERYWERIRTRPAAIRACELDDALLPPEQRLGPKS